MVDFAQGDMLGDRQRGDERVGGLSGCPKGTRKG